MGYHGCSFNTLILFRVSEVTLILAALASIIFEWSLFCILAKGVLHTNSKTVADDAAMEGAAPRFL